MTGHVQVCRRVDLRRSWSAALGVAVSEEVSRCHWQLGLMLAALWDSALARLWGVAASCCNILSANSQLQE